jgi:hypothetical protein
MFKFVNIENTLISQENGPTFPITHGFYKERVLPWVADGNTISPFSGAVTPIDQVKINLKLARNKSLSEVTVTVGGKVIWANPAEEQNIRGKIFDMEEESQTTCKWIQGFNIYELTLDELKTVLKEGTRKCAVIYDDYIAAIEAL